MHEQIEMCIAASATGIAETPNKVISRQPQERGDGWVVLILLMISYQ